jgi:hypothetical protein
LGSAASNAARVVVPPSTYEDAAAGAGRASHADAIASRGRVRFVGLFDADQTALRKTRPRMVS